MSNVYILGSGFSASAGLPTLLNLFPEILKYETRGEDDVDNVNNGLSFLYPHFKPETPGTYPPFEEFLSLVRITEDFGAVGYELGAFEKEYWLDIYRSGLRLLTDCIDSKAKEATKSDKIDCIRKFADNLNAGDVIITFNWDTLVEKMLLEKRIDFSLNGRDSSKINILKLHGSLSWIQPPENLVPKQESAYFFLSEDEKILCVNNHDYVDPWDVIYEPPYIIPPISSKTPVSSNFLKGLWYEAFGSLIEAEIIVVIGYSLPPEDLHARSLMRSGILSNKSLILIDPNPAIAGRYFATITSNIKYFQLFFSGDELKDIIKPGP